MSVGIFAADEIIHDLLKDVGIVTVTFGDPNQVDLNKQNIFPLTHIVLSGNARTQSTQTVTYSIAVLDVPDSNNLDPREMQNNFRLTSNFEDIWHDLDYRLNEMLQKANRRSDGVLLGNFDSMIPVRYKAQNMLVGWELDVTLTIPAQGLC